MKKIISFIIVFAMVLSTTTSFAAPDFSDFVDSLGGEYSDGLDLLQDVPVPTDISVKTQSASDFENGPLILSLYNANNTKFSFKASIDMGKVKTRYEAYEDLAQALIAGDTALEAELNNCTVSGQFTITINYPTENFTVNPAAKTDTAMVGFTSVNGRHLEVFEEVSRNATTDGEIVIIIKVKDGTTLADLDALSDLYLTYDDNRITAAGEYTIRGTVAGQTTIKYDNEEIDEIAYLFEQEVGKENDSDYRDPADDISATVFVQGSSPSTSIGGGSVARKTLSIMDGETELSKKQYIAGTTVETGKLEMPQKDGYVFAGYYYDKELTKPVEEIFKLTDDTTIYVKWNECVLNETSHFAYIIGYPMEDGREEVRPEKRRNCNSILSFVETGCGRQIVKNRERLYRCFS